MKTPALTSSISILIEALPYIQKFSSKSIVIKLGGAMMQDISSQQNFARDIVLLQYVGIKPIIVHGGGPQISQMLQKLAIPYEFVEGHRVTDNYSMEVVEMVLSGKINKDIVALINKMGGRSVGLSGRDGNIASAEPLSLEKINTSGKKEKITLGRAGRLYAKDISPTLLKELEGNGYIPVIAPIATDEDGNALNINADMMASAIAIAMGAKKLILLTDTSGVLINKKIVEYIHPRELSKLKATKQILGGMLPKLSCCIDAVNLGVDQAHIIDGRVPHAIFSEIFTDKGIGTMISKNKPLASKNK